MTARSAYIVACLVTLLSLFLVGCGRAKPDIKKVGGYVLVFAVESTASPVGPELALAVEQRLDAFGYHGSEARLLGNGRIEVTVPGAAVADLEKVSTCISMVGHLEFRILAEQDDLPENTTDDASDQDESKPPLENSKWAVFDPDDVTVTPPNVTRDTLLGEREVLVLLDDLNLTGNDLEWVSEGEDPAAQACINASFSEAGGRKMKTLTSQNLPDPQTGKARRLGIILDNRLLSAPRLMTTIQRRVQLTGIFSKHEVSTLVSVMKAGRLPVKLAAEPIKTTHVPASN